MFPLFLKFRFGPSRNRNRGEEGHSVLDVDEIPLDPAYQYRDNKGYTHTRRFASPSPRHPAYRQPVSREPDRKYIVNDTDNGTFCTQKQCLYVFIAITTILLIAVVAVTIMIGTGRIICANCFVYKRYASWSRTNFCSMINGWQLVKMKKSIPDMSLSWNL